MEIVNILVEDQGWFYSKDGKIEEFTVNGEMALITWYKQVLPSGHERRFNGKYVIQVNTIPVLSEN